MIVPALLTLAGILPEDQGGGAVLWPERRDGQPAGTWAPRRLLPPYSQYHHQPTTARDTRRHPGDPGCAGRDHPLTGATRLASGWIPQLVGHRSRPPGHWCQQQAAVGVLLDQVTGRKADLRP